VSKDSILEQDLLEIDGTGKRGKGTIGILGGLLGQIMICYHTIVKHFPDLDKRQDEDGYDDNERAVLNPVSV